MFGHTVSVERGILSVCPCTLCFSFTSTSDWTRTLLKVCETRRNERKSSSEHPDRREDALSIDHLLSITRREDALKRDAVSSS